MAFKYPDLQERQKTAAAAKKALLEKFKAASNDPAIAEREAARVAINEARLARAAEREAAKKTREAELAAQAARDAELAAQAKREAEAAAARAEAEERDRADALRRNRRPSATPVTRHARLPKRNGGAAIDIAARRGSRAFNPKAAVAVGFARARA